MGYSSYLCNHCDKGIVDASGTDEGINEWMAHVVMLSDNGSRMIEEKYGGYEGEYEQFSMSDSVWVHFACWEVAGKPEFEAYDGPSKHDPDQGCGSFRGSHDIIDPRITDEDERARLLAEGIAGRTKRQFDHHACEVRDWMQMMESSYIEEEYKEHPWKRRWDCYETYPHTPEGVFIRGLEKDGTWWHISDQLDNELPDVESILRGTEEEVLAEMAHRWARFLESDEHAAYMARAKELSDAHYREELEKYKATGRYEVSYCPPRSGRDTVKKEGERDWHSGRTMYTVEDRLTYKRVATMDKPLKALGSKTFVADPDYDGNQSAEWEARMEVVRAATHESHRLAEEKAQELNDKWARDGYPPPKKWNLD